jgi:hypothetical protein
MLENGYWQISWEIKNTQGCTIVYQSQEYCQEMEG